MKIALRLTLAIFMSLALTGLAAGPSEAAPATDAASLTGMFGTTWADSQEGDGLPPRFELHDDQGNDYLLNLSPDLVAKAGGSAALDGTQVTVEGSFDLGALDQSGSPSFNVANIIAGGAASALGELTGPQPWAVVMCKFSDKSSEPRGRSYFQGLFGTTFPGIGDFWSRVSYGAVNLQGTTVMSSWKTLPHARSYYIGSSANLQALTNDCTGAADSSIDFSKFAGVAMMFNYELDGYAWGGMTDLNGKDGVRGIRAAWMPPWGFENQNILAHEVGHGFGLPHSSGPYSETYDSPWDVMSGWPPCANPKTYGCVGVETISYHRYLLGWIPSDRIFTANVGSSEDVKLERLAQPTSPPGSYLMAIVPIPGSSTRFYTVEARRHIDSVSYNDYEEEIMGNAVVIHQVDTTRGDRVAQVVDGDHNGNVRDSGSMWTVGETYRDSSADISISVMSSTSTGYLVRINNGGLDNDSPSSAKVIAAYPFSSSLDTAKATTAGDDPIFPCAGSPGNASVWYKLTPTARGLVQLSTVGSDYDTILGVWTGSPGSMKSKACDDDSGGNGASVISVAVAASTTYYIEVAGKTGAGVLNLSLGLVPCYRLSRSATPSDMGGVSASPAPNCGVNYYTKGTSVQVTAQAKDGRVFKVWSGSISGSSNPSSLTMGGNRNVAANFQVAAPTLLSPTGGASVKTLRPTLDWSDVPGATYLIQYSKYSSFSSATSLTSSRSTIKTASDLTKNVTYYWRVRAIVNGIQSNWSAGKFKSANPPSTPVLKSPANGATSVRLQPLLDWYDSSNSPAGYQVQLSRSTRFSTLVINYALVSSAYRITNPLEAGTTYYWRVRAYNSATQYSNWSAVFSFSTAP